MIAGTHQLGLGLQFWGNPQAAHGLPVFIAQFVDQLLHGVVHLGLAAGLLNADTGWQFNLGQALDAAIGDAAGHQALAAIDLLRIETNKAFLDACFAAAPTGEITQLAAEFLPA